MKTTELYKVDKSLSRKSVTWLFGCLVFFAGLSFLGYRRLSNVESYLIFAAELLSLGVCLWIFMGEYIPRNLKNRYVWYFINPEDSRYERVWAVTDKHIPKVPVAFRIKLSGWFAESKVFIDGQPSDDWRVSILGDKHPHNVHQLIIYDQGGVPFCLSYHGQDSIKYQLWLIGKFEDLSKYYGHISAVHDQRLDLLAKMTALRDISVAGGQLGNKWPVKVVHDFADDAVSQFWSTSDIRGDEKPADLESYLGMRVDSAVSTLETKVRFATPSSRSVSS